MLRNRLSHIVIGLSVLTCLVAVNGCSSLSLIPKDWGISDSNIPLEATGKAANTLAHQVAMNISTASSRLADTQKYNSWLYVSLIVLFVGGIIFWFYTKSRFGFVIPVAAIIGLGLITAFARYGEWIGLSVILGGVGLLVWKAIEYQRERNTLIADKVNS